MELSLWDKDERELVQGNKVGLAELGHFAWRRSAPRIASWGLEFVPFQGVEKPIWVECVNSLRVTALVLCIRARL